MAHKYSAQEKQAACEMCKRARNMLQRENGPQAKWQIAKIYQAAQKCAANDEKAASRGSKISKNVKTISAKGKRG